ncbi:hypothetical protein [Uliginosibacterium gangwonense]|uniref:hypothetical protein n=1 Tax=Uliginosibacterium gangwonense TaxID=392736 RepID=UPI0003A9BE7F|nr:hypothetical protein [Uliginosibacterium gangwonense]
MRQRLLLVCITLFLLLGQQGAAVHALRHLGEALASTSPHKESPTAPQHLCEECLAFAALGAALNAQTPPQATATSWWLYVSPGQTTAFVAVAHAFQSRAPPLQA